MLLKEPVFAYSTCGTFTKNKERIHKFKETENSRYIYQNESDKAYLQHNMVFGDFKDLPRRTTSDKVLRDKTFNIAKNSKYHGYQRGLTSILYKFFDKVSGGAVADESAIKSKIMSNQQLAEELHQPIIRKVEKQKNAPKDNIWVLI